MKTMLRNRTVSTGWWRNRGREGFSAKGTRCVASPVPVPVYGMGRVMARTHPRRHLNCVGHDLAWNGVSTKCRRVGVRKDSARHWVRHENRNALLTAGWDTRWWGDGRASCGLQGGNHAKTRYRNLAWKGSASLLDIFRLLARHTDTLVVWHLNLKGILRQRCLADRCGRVGWGKAEALLRRLFGTWWTLHHWGSQFDTPKSSFLIGGNASGELALLSLTKICVIRVDLVE